MNHFSLNREVCPLEGECHRVASVGITFACTISITVQEFLSLLAPLYSKLSFSPLLLCRSFELQHFLFLEKAYKPEWEWIKQTILKMEGVCPELSKCVRKEIQWHWRIFLFPSTFPGGKIIRSMTSAQDITFHSRSQVDYSLLCLSSHYMTLSKSTLLQDCQCILF